MTLVTVAACAMRVGGLARTACDDTGAIAEQIKDRMPAGVMRIRADNPSLLTLDGTNTYVAGGWVVDPGPADEGHLEAVLAAAGGQIEGIVLTHSHSDHAEGAAPLADRVGAAQIRLPEGGEEVGPFRSIATPGHAPDHVCLLFGRVLFTGDTVLGTGSVFIAPGEGSMSAYIGRCSHLRELDLDVLCPGHGPIVWDPAAKLDEYLSHRLERERLLLRRSTPGYAPRESCSTVPGRTHRRRCGRRRR